VTVTLTDLGTSFGGSVEFAVIETTTGKYVGADGRLQTSAHWQARDNWANLVIRGLTPATTYKFASKARIGGTETDLSPEATATTTATGDVSGDGAVTNSDLGLLRRALSTSYGEPNFDARADLDGDGQVTYRDLGLLRRAMGR